MEDIMTQWWWFCDATTWAERADPLDEDPPQEEGRTTHHQALHC